MAAQLWLGVCPLASSEHWPKGWVPCQHLTIVYLATCLDFVFLQGHRKLQPTKGCPSIVTTNKQAKPPAPSHSKNGNVFNEICVWHIFSQREETEATQCSPIKNCNYPRDGSHLATFWSQVTFLLCLLGDSSVRLFPAVRKGNRTARENHMSAMLATLWAIITVSLMTSHYESFQNMSVVVENKSLTAGNLCVIKSGLCHLVGEVQIQISAPMPWLSEQLKSPPALIRRHREMI